MPEAETVSVKNVCLGESEELVISTVKKAATVRCDVCGAENDAKRELCRVCSNYLESNKEVD